MHIYIIYIYIYIYISYVRTTTSRNFPEEHPLNRSLGILGGAKVTGSVGSNPSEVTHLNLFPTHV